MYDISKWTANVSLKQLLNKNLNIYKNKSTFSFPPKRGYISLPLWLFYTWKFEKYDTHIEASKDKDTIAWNWMERFQWKYSHINIF